jgi:hypothetical protein
VGLEALRKLTEHWAKTNRGTAPMKALMTYCHAMMNSAGFSYVD